MKDFLLIQIKSNLIHFIKKKKKNQILNRHKFFNGNSFLIVDPLFLTVI